MALPSAGYDKAIYQAPAGDITGFTAMINSENFSADFWTDVNSSDGTRARFAKDSTPTEIPFDFIDFDDTGESGWARVFIGNSFAADSVATRTIRAYSPNTRNTAYSASDTYGSDNAYDGNWEGYWPNGGGIDRTSNSFDLTAEGSVVAGDTVGKIGDATNYNGTDEYYHGTAPITAVSLTFLTWFRTPSSSVVGAMLNLADASVANSQFSLFLQSNLVKFMTYSPSAIEQIQATTIYSTDTWTHAAGKTSAINSRAILQNAANKATGSAVVTPTGIDTFGIGASVDSTKIYFSGDLQEVQLHSGNRFDDWISEEYSQTNDNATFWGTWAWTSPDGVTHQLAGSIDSASQLTGLLNLTQRLSGSLNTVSSTTGVLRLIQRLSGSLNSSSVVSGTIRLIHGLSGSMQSVSTVMGKIRLIQRLRGAINSISTLTGRLRLIQRISGIIESHSHLSGNLTISGAPVTHQLSGSIESHSHLSGTLADDSLIETLYFNIDKTENLAFAIDKQTESDFNIDKITELDYDITME